MVRDEVETEPPVNSVSGYCLGARPLSLPLFDQSASGPLLPIHGRRGRGPPGKMDTSLYFDRHEKNTMSDPSLSQLRDAMSMQLSRLFTHCTREALPLELPCFQRAS